MMQSLKEKIGKINLLAFATILIYSFIAAILFGYTGLHWLEKISSNQRMLLNLITILISIIIILGILKYNISIVNKLNYFLSKIRLMAVFSVALVLRLAWVCLSNVQQSSDFLLYNEAAIEILNGSNILSYISTPRTVGPSVFVAIHYFVFGQNQIFPLISIALLSSLQILLIYSMILRIVNKNAAVLASLILAFYPEHILLTNLIGSDVLFSTICYLGLFFATKAYYSKSSIKILYLLSSGIIWGVAHWTRATAVIFLFSTIIFFLVSNISNFRTRLKDSIIIITGFILIIFPIIIYNYSIYGYIDIKPIHGQQGKSLLIGTFFEGQGRSEYWFKLENHGFLDQKINNFVINKYGISPDKIGEIRLLNIQDEVYTKIAIQRILESPIKFSIMVLKDKITNLWGIVAGLGFSLDTSVLMKYKNIVWAYSEIWHRLTIILCGLVLLFKVKTKIWIWDTRQIFIFSAVLSTLSHLFLESHPRYHHMFIPILAMYLSEFVTTFHNFHFGNENLKFKTIS